MKLVLDIQLALGGTHNPDVAWTETENTPALHTHRPVKRKKMSAMIMV